MKGLASVLLVGVCGVGGVVGGEHHAHQEKRPVVTIVNTKYVTVGANEVVKTMTTMGPDLVGKKPLKDFFSEPVATGAVSVEAEESKGSAGLHVGDLVGDLGKLGASIAGDLMAFVRPSEKFADGVVPCGEFPAGQGAVSVPWVGLGGWSSVMDADGHTASECQDGYYCSYACQAGMSKTQWPAEQPGDGKSMGGLYCKDGYLYRTNAESEYLCEWGVDAAVAVNNKDSGIAMCRTDYPASENMVVPTVLSPGDSKPVSIVDGDTYYKWRGMRTSTQYYVNNAGVSVEDGCVWGEPGSGIGNWAPVVLGAGHVGGITYLSIIPNPNNRDPPNFNVKIVASKGSNVIGDCKYENGVYSHGSDGCTASVLSGSAQFVFY
ncbi:SUN family protein UTH1 Ecym_5229 [Eremothecium cymbalariae DBVPG|uniref:Uncharacterized protein n=1 Tax=Eremothecium cymbalariae (strain CBS 270.75 / DBVPG 7215 / KCTC 17166 / NRRL Y-17582) TaxID=931890 RepID=I6ND55_ERECY|nr:hypothetical protein Ecym_5229 [Eremothecium cymbalariae DBVPG\